MLESDSLNYSALKFWLDLLQWLVTLMLAGFMWIDRGRKGNVDAIRELSEAHQELERRLVVAEETLRHVPTHDDITRLSNQYAGLEAKLDRVTNTLDRIHDYLMAARK